MCQSVCGLNQTQPICGLDHFPVHILEWPEWPQATPGLCCMVLEPLPLLLGYPGQSWSCWCWVALHGPKTATTTGLHGIALELLPLPGCTAWPQSCCCMQHGPRAACSHSEAVLHTAATPHTLWVTLRATGSTGGHIFKSLIPLL